ncbi:probable leucine-rich repeat receptor-like protein kinase At1g35710 [Prosopis cineraria]|uniref:probable leucine-rich repeat receptor-like protein kinase At1g35710 n=1 Tax=Prosopis cineraria TaxID=364024 RepID=UPI00240F6A60|nr:probable leucine-rich repeat receptor-like protein kinase At1g35710 [Prosopis cineraria]
MRNKFSRGIPSCLANVTSLRDLYLDSNKLISEIPPSFWNLKDILRVNLSSNIVVGNVSLRIENLNALELLDLSRNHISGFIPTTLGGLKNLQDLSLAHNNLQGNIPESFGNMLSLVKLDLSENDLSRQIPKSLEFLSALKGSYGSVFKGKLSSGMIIAIKIFKFDSQPSNILMDDEMVAHVSDFGISKLLDKEESKTNTETIPTIGYVAPVFFSENTPNHVRDSLHGSLGIVEVDDLGKYLGIYSIWGKTKTQALAYVKEKTRVNNSSWDSFRCFVLPFPGSNQQSAITCFFGLAPPSSCASSSIHWELFVASSFAFGFCRIRDPWKKMLAVGYHYQYLSSFIRKQSETGVDIVTGTRYVNGSGVHG